MRRLNGWQRIFVLLTIGWLMVCLGFAAQNWPTENTYRAVVSAKAFQVVPEAFISRRAMADCISRHRREGGTYSPFECDAEAIAGVKPEDKQQYDALVESGEAQMGHVLLRDRAGLFVVCLVAWLGDRWPSTFASWHYIECSGG